jgi:PAS domain S-box-containing protein
MPVTQIEHHPRVGSILVSKTDLEGIITYCNRDFIEISGYKEQELLGSSHNIVQYSDMPPEAYADLWETIKAGNPWGAVVKNRCKNGDFLLGLCECHSFERGGGSDRIHVGSYSSNP